MSNKFLHYLSLGIVTQFATQSELKASKTVSWGLTTEEEGLKYQHLQSPEKVFFVHNIRCLVTFWLERQSHKD
ncbi:MAG TPA: hypothetical protein DCE56_32945 [Cyanobacteria bacterium UBA8553]|nr:hypothetical protein [Cyanobacteria bacterium UBA8553]HAJ59151.1 hypothetical protein [Cyanobacteria bacterium UBA8543]